MYDVDDVTSLGKIMRQGHLSHNGANNLMKSHLNIFMKSILSNTYFLNPKTIKNYVDKILALLDHLPPCVEIFYGMNVDKRWTFLDHLPTSSCKRSL